MATGALWWRMSIVAFLLDVHSSCFYICVRHCLHCHLIQLCCSPPDSSISPARIPILQTEHWIRTRFLVSGVFNAFTNLKHISNTFPREDVVMKSRTRASPWMLFIGFAMVKLTCLSSERLHLFPEHSSTPEKGMP